jgi:ribosomal protein S18 acetylase RimI-like enzyme
MGATRPQQGERFEYWRLHDIGWRISILHQRATYYEFLPWKDHSWSIIRGQGGHDFKQVWAIESMNEQGEWRPEGRSDNIWFRQQVEKSPDIYFDATAAKQAAAAVYRSKIAIRQTEINDLSGYLRALDLPDDTPPMTAKQVAREILGFEPSDTDVAELQEVFWTKPIGSALLKTLVTCYRENKRLSEELADLSGAAVLDAVLDEFGVPTESGGVELSIAGRIRALWSKTVQETNAAWSAKEKGVGP